MLWLPDGEKTEDMFIYFDKIHERDRQTDRQTPLDGIGRPYKMSSNFVVLVEIAGS